MFHLPKRTGDGSERRTHPVFTILGWLSLLLFPAFCMTVMEYCNYRALTQGGRVIERLITFVTEYSLHALFGVLVLYTVFIIVLLLVRRAWIATGIFGFFCMFASFINYMKIELNSVPFVPADVALIGVTRELASYVVVPMPRLYWIAVGVAVIWTVLLALWHIKIPGKWFVTPPIALAMIIAIGVYFADVDRGTRLLNRFGMDIFDNVLQTSNYTANGFVSGFTLNLIGMRVVPPEDYSREAVEALLSGYTEKEKDPGQEDFDVILVLSESFFDLRKLENVTYSENPLPNYDRLLADENCYSGDIYTIAHGGGTVNTEFRVLTGLNTDRLLPVGGTPYNYVYGDLPGYVSNYRQAGYHTMGLHLYNPNFYGRKRTYPHLGFDVLHDLEDTGDKVSVYYTRGYATDDSTERAIEYYMDQAAETGDPTFLFAITIENHQPYGENEDNTITVETDLLHGITAQALTTYAQGAKDADTMLGALKDYIDGRDRPTVLVWFGDHLPTLGISYDPYFALGYFPGAYYDPETRLAMFSTPFLVYANRPLEGSAFPAKSGSQISDIYLMECVARATGFTQTRYMQFLADAMETLPYYNVELNMDDTLTPEQQEIVRAWQLLGYDRLLGKNYTASEP